MKSKTSEAEQKYLLQIEELEKKIEENRKKFYEDTGPKEIYDEFAMDLMNFHGIEPGDSLKLSKEQVKLKHEYNNLKNQNYAIRKEIERLKHEELAKFIEKKYDVKVVNPYYQVKSTSNYCRCTCHTEFGDGRDCRCSCNTRKDGW